MFQLLLKATKPQESASNEQSQSTNQQIISKRTGAQVGNGWGTPPSRQSLGKRADQDATTPAFLQKLNDLGHKIQQVQECIEHVPEYQRSQKVSQIFSVNQMGDPMILSQINNEKQGVDRLAFLRIRNYISELKQVHYDLAEYLQDERRLNEDFQDKFCLDVEDFFIQFKRKLLQGGGSANSQELRAQNGSLREKLQQKQSQCFKISKQLSEARIMIDQQRSRGTRRIGSREDIPQTGPCSNCKILESNMNTLNQGMKHYEQQIQNLRMQNQRLQEHVFDIQQQFAGIDLQVEKRLKQKLVMVPQYYKSAPQSPAQSMSKNHLVEKLKNEMILLQQKCRRFEEATNNHHQFDQRYARLQQIQRQLQSRQNKVREANKRAEELKQANYQREHQILQAQQNLQKKINDLRIKQVDLSRWEADLVRKANETRPANNAHFPAEQTSYRVGSVEDLNRSAEISLRSFGKSPNPLEGQDKISPRIRTQHPEISGKSSLYSPHSHQIYSHKYDHGEALGRNETRKYVENGYPTRTRERESPVVTIMTKKTGLTGSNYQIPREASPYRTINDQRTRAAQHIAMGQNVVHPYRDASKNSRKSSAAKSVRGSYGVPIPPMKPRVEGQQLTGLGNKLQRLREQIKRQIDSIK